MSNVEREKIRGWFIGIVFSLWIIVSLAYTPDTIHVSECKYITANIVGKRLYCTYGKMDCKYTIAVSSSDGKFNTEVIVPKEKYEFGLVGEQMNVLICK